MPRYFLPLLILSLVACCIEVDISVPSFPDMGHYFNVGEGAIQMTIAYNFLGFCIGAAVVIFAMIADAYPAKDKAAKLVGSMNAVLTILMATAPIAGGFINEAVGWRGNYSIVALISLISWICLVFFLPETRNAFEDLCFSKIKKDYQQLITNRLFLSASIVPSLSYAAYLAFITQASFLYIVTYELTLMDYVLHQCIIILVFSITSLLSGSIIQKLGARGCITTGVPLSCLSALGMVLVGLLAPKSPYLMTFFMSLVGLGGAISYPVIFAGSLEIFPDIKGTASSAIMSMRSFLCFAFVALTSYLYNGDPLRIALIVLGGNIICLFFTVYLLRSNPFIETSSPQNAS